MIERKFTVKNSAGEKLACVEVLPKAASSESVPAIVMCHGFDWIKEETVFMALLKPLTEKGYGVYYFDLSGCGESEGDYAKTSLTKLAGDLRAVLDEVKNYSYIEDKHISLMGQSFGTNVCVAVQELGAERMVLCGAFDDPRKLLASLFRDSDLSGDVTLKRSDGRVTKISPQFWEDFSNHDLNALIANYNCPILFIHGAEDDVVPLSMAQQLKAHAKQAQIKVIDGADHTLRHDLDRTAQIIAKFFI